MRYTYDAEADALYLYLAPDVRVVRQEEIGDVLVDFDSDGRPLGIEVLSPRTLRWDPEPVLAALTLDEADAASVRFFAANQSWAGKSAHTGGAGLLVPA